MEMVARPVRATLPSTWWWNSATPSSVAAKRMKSTGMPTRDGPSAPGAASASGEAKKANKPARRCRRRSSNSDFINSPKGQSAGILASLMQEPGLRMEADFG